MLKSKGNKICKLISKHNFAQGLNFSYCERNILISTTVVININKTKNRELFIEAFLSILTWVLQFTVIAKLSFVADFFNSQDGD